MIALNLNQSLNINQQQTNMTDTSFSFIYCIDLGHNHTADLLIYSHSDPYLEASKFCAKHSLDPKVITILGDSIRDQIQSQATQPICSEQSEIGLQMTHSRSDLRNRDTQKYPRFNTLRSENPYDRNQEQKRLSRQNSVSKKSIFRSSFKYESSETIATVSNSQSTLYLSKIIPSMTINSKSKKNPVSTTKKLFFEKNILKNLINESQQKQQCKRKQISRKESVNSFYKPVQIRYSVQKIDKKPKTSQIKAIPRSQQLTDKAFRAKFQQIYWDLKKNNSTLSFEHLDFKTMTNCEKLLSPIYNQMRILRETLNESQFIEACMRFIPYLLPHDKAALRSRSKKVTPNKKPKHSTAANGLGIFERGIVYLQRSLEKKDRLREKLLKKTQIQCSFHPNIRFLRT